MNRLLQILKWVAYLVIGLVSLALIGLQATKTYLRTATKIDTPNGISSLEEITLGGLNQWIFIRGTDQNNPVLLFLHGGPGEPALGMSSSRTLDAELINHFTVVHWDQRSAGKSYHPDIPVASMSFDRLVEDCNELIDHLRARFGIEKVFLVGHSGGTPIGLKVAHRYPEKIHAYVGVSQIVNDYEQQRLSYEFVVAEAEKSGDVRTQNAVEAIGPPPYETPDKIFKKAEYVVRYGGFIHTDLVKNMGMVGLGYLTSPEYSLMEGWQTANRQGLNFTTGARWGEITDFDFSQEIASIQVPLYFFVGKYDMIVPTAHIEDFYNRLNAEQGKHLIVFENSAHMLPVEEKAKYQDMLINVVLKESQAQAHAELSH